MATTLQTPSVAQGSTAAWDVPLKADLVAIRNVADAAAANAAWSYGIQPRVVWSGTAWPTRTSSIPAGYAGAVEYWSPYDNTATSPTDRVLNDLWTRKP